MAKFANVDDYIAALPEDLREVATALRPIVNAALPGSIEAMYHGSPTWSAGEAAGKNLVCLMKAYSSYVTFALWKGQLVNDESGKLEASARQMAHVKLRSLADIDADLFTGWLKEARDLETAAAAR
ncbi:DUF1801 domain-containing protein [Amycolatopsis regifaucium]|uniref:YdhG-like domain-containing protein n=1 Tax=Amycolatopsis regifaucium TaxID=546365 RepID=A0A154MQZ0_9PSEU|nr:DUF1801 domain-containing protein [Amycolatopsis regifaucium]KZB86685.1 hypothetical protein AVL48_25980 [Amycolatopsis regifaucium]OKA03682.1 hypothetical protein ATP06_0234990 [Amycolatopsis regifaucium]SFJ21693.1 hypothetical protein SAMN04489731_11761 [Amycolatopsis regifaucium]